MTAQNTASQSVRLDRETIYQSPWVNLFVDKVRLPQGRVIDRYHVLDFEREAVAVVVQNANDDILMVKCDRYVLGTTEWEVPSGIVDEGESVLPAAQREVLEESGYQTSHVRHLYSFNPENGMSNRVFHVAHCRAEGPAGTFDGNEIHAVHWRSIDDVKQMIRTQQLHDGFSLTALLVFLMDR
jgi:ADP-ribose pyrophosphatase